MARPKQPVVDTPYQGSWADLMARKAFPPPGPSQHPIHFEQDRLMRQQGFKFDRKR